MAINRAPNKEETECKASDVAFIKQLLQAEHLKAQSKKFESLRQQGLQETNLFIAPNEHSQTLLRSHLAKAPKGAYIGVGADRGFMAAALMPEVTSVYLTDYSPEIVLFNRINIALLAIAQDRNDYVQLRLNAFCSDNTCLWENFLQESPAAKPWIRLLLANKKNQLFWKKNVIQNEDENMKALHLPPHQLTSTTEGFVNYLHEDRYFYPLQKLAREEKLHPVQMNFNDATQISGFFDALKTGNIKIAVLDLSNAWWDCFIDRANLLASVSRFQEQSFPQSLLILTHKNKILLPQSQHPQKSYTNEFCYKLFFSKNLSGKSLGLFTECLSQKLVKERSGHIFANLAEALQVNPHLAEAKANLNGGSADDEKYQNKL
jgi:hypothetical protein